MTESRTTNSIKNVSSGIIVQVINKLMAFVVRTIFIKVLSSEYLGINGLFTNILSMLSFAELGIGTAIIFSMYKPIAEDNEEKIKSLMNLYKKFYIGIGIFIAIVGICIIPFLKYIVKDAPTIKENIICIYLLYLFNSSSSYFFTYKKSIISAYQKERILNTIDSIFYIIKSIMEILFLIITHNFIVYLCVQIGMTVFENVVISIKANKMFPFLKSKDVKKLSPDETKSIFSKVKSLFIYKIGVSILTGTDNIIISAIIDISTVGLCSNYTLIIESVKSVILTAFNGITASVGNLNAVGEKRKKENIFNQLTFISFWIFGFCTIAFIVLLNPFIRLWLGEKYCLPYIVSISLALSFFVLGLRNSAYIYRTTLGLFEKGKYTPFIASIINIVLSILLGKLIGVSGVYFATAISQMLSYSIIDPYIVYKYEFETPLRKYWYKIIKYYIILTIGGIVTFLLSYHIKYTFMGFIARIAIVAIVPNVIFGLTLYKSTEFKSLLNIFIQYLSKIKNRLIKQNVN